MICLHRCGEVELHVFLLYQGKSIANPLLQPSHHLCSVFMYDVCILPPSSGYKLGRNLFSLQKRWKLLSTLCWALSVYCSEIELWSSLPLVLVCNLPLPPPTLQRQHFFSRNPANPKKKTTFPNTHLPIFQTALPTTSCWGTRTSTRRKRRRGGVDVTGGSSQQRQIQKNTAKSSNCSPKTDEHSVYGGARARARACRQVH